MNMPGFTADAAVYESQSQYRIGASFLGQEKVVNPQWVYSSWGIPMCVDEECVRQCYEDIFPDICASQCLYPCPRIIPNQ
jgi:hypothetical protein